MNDEENMLKVKKIKTNYIKGTKMWRSKHNSLRNSARQKKHI